MITRRDCLLLLSELSGRGIDTSSQVKLALQSSEVNHSVVEFINKHRPLDVSEFYAKIRKSYNHKKSMLYKNIVTCDESEDTSNVLTTLAALNLQILLFRKQATNDTMFMSHTRFEEINHVLLTYSQTFNLVPCIQLLQVIKADLKAFESLN